MLIGEKKKQWKKNLSQPKLTCPKKRKKNMKSIFNKANVEEEIKK
jgi:hypothetical protein